jgi:flavin-binding protein dodecin
MWGVLFTAVCFWFCPFPVSLQGPWARTPARRSHAEDADAILHDLTRRQDSEYAFPAFGPYSIQELTMAQKIIDLLGVSKESFAKAAKNAVEEAAKTIHGIKWARVAEFEMALEGKEVVEYRALTKIYFDIER